jgi:ArsR family transcriptional regulator, arsenate/arsenite/antimonite-responsive transcriptional repressor
MECCNKEKSKKELRALVDFLKAISEENRLKILCILQKESLCVCEIWRLLELPQNLVSHHLKILKDFGLVDSRKKGTKVFYSLNKTNSKKYIGLLSRYI